MTDGKKPALVALRDQRDAAIELLTQRFAEGVLDMDEFEDRVDAAHQADSATALEKVVKDLMPLPEAEREGNGESHALAVREQVSESLETARAQRKRMIAIMGGVERRGQWRVPKTLTVYTLMGGASLDFREAVLPPGVTEVKVRALMGGVEIIVPPHVAVECEGTAIMGGFEDVHRSPRDPDPDVPLLRVSGLAIMGGCSIETRLPGESHRDARRRMREEERHALRDSDHNALPAPRKQLPGEPDDHGKP